MRATERDGNRSLVEDEKVVPPEGGRRVTLENGGGCGFSDSAR